ncbi:MAG: hypothetical protein HYT93_03525 [Parcubacteria group bacterium]|nr:hypothetical protein [Parcubacteria group bacterium]
MNEKEPSMSFEAIAQRTKKLHHYYGDYVRNMFLIGAVIVLLSLPLFTHLLATPIIYPILVVGVLVVAAGFANPAQKWTMILNVAVAAMGIVFFEYQALLTERMATHVDLHKNIFFLESHALALLFLFALYFSIKTVRGRFMKREIRDID